MLKNKYNLIFNIAGDWERNFHRQALIEAYANHEQIEKIIVVNIPADFVHSLLKKKYRFKNAIISLRKTIKVNQKIYIYTPLIFIHFKIGFKFKFFRKLNKLLYNWSMRRLIIREKLGNNILSCVYCPEFIDFINFSDKLKIIYDCYDEYLLSSEDKFQNYLVKAENELISKSFVVFTTSINLQKKAKTNNINSYFIPNAAKINLFKKAYVENLKIPDDLKLIKKPIIGYIGVFRNWMDFELLKFIIEEHQNKSFVFVGNWLKNVTDTVEMFDNYKNVFFLGQKQISQIPAYLKYIDITMIPNKMNKFNKNVLPYKLYEYMAAGKKIISTNTSQDMKDFYSDYIQVANTKEQFSEKIESMLTDKKFDSKKIFSFGIKQSWNSRVEDMLNIINRLV